MAKRIRINTSVVELNGRNVNVFRKGEQVKTIIAIDIPAQELFERECQSELARHMRGEK